MKAKKDISKLALLFVTGGLIISNGILLYQNFQLRKTVDRAKRLVTDVGFRFSDVQATTINGEAKSISFGHDGKQTVLLTFNTNCVYCVQQYPTWKRLASSLNLERWNLIAITSQTDVDLIRKHLEENGLEDFDVRLVTQDDIGKARMGYTPMTVVVDSAGVVRRVFPGLWTEEFGIGE